MYSTFFLPNQILWQFPTVNLNMNLDFRFVNIAFLAYNCIEIITSDPI